MTRILGLVLFLFISQFYHADAQMAATGAGCAKASCSANACTPACPGDIITYVAWYGFRCYSFAYSGSVADIADGSDMTGTRLQCSGGVMSASSSGSACTFVTGNACSPIATTCAVSCNLRTWYDQSGANACSGGVPCDQVQATIANRPGVMLSALNTSTCTVQTAGQGMQSANSLTAATAQPYTVTSVWDVTAGGSTRTGFGNASGLVIFGQEFSAGNAFAFAGAAAQASATTNAFHAIIDVVNGASTSITVDGSTTSSLNASTASFDNAPASGTNVFTAFAGNICEEGFAAGDKTSSISTLNTNMHAAYGSW